jgi:SAM-dependent methyltransferase
MRELVLGCGNYPYKRIYKDSKEYINPTRVDIDSNCKPDIILDLNTNSLPFSDDTFDEVHMYEVLEHLGTQGDYKHFFSFFNEVARVLKPDGLFIASVPAMNSPWVWGDPGHTRVIPPEILTFLDQDEYFSQVGKTPMTDYRDIYTSSFKILLTQEKESIFNFVLKNIK